VVEAALVADGAARRARRSSSRRGFAELLREALVSRDAPPPNVLPRRARAGGRDDAALLWGSVDRLEDEVGVPIQDRERLLRALGRLDDGRVHAGRGLSDDEAAALAAVWSRA
jgi:hypothetical protein